MTSSLTPTQIAQQALARYAESPLLTRLANPSRSSLGDYVKRWDCERILKEKTVTICTEVYVNINTIKDVLDFVEAVALVTANTEEHEAFSEIEVYAEDTQLCYHHKTLRPATEEELKAAEEWLAANPQEPGQPIKWRPLTIPFRVNIDNGDTNND